MSDAYENAPTIFEIAESFRDAEVAIQQLTRAKNVYIVDAGRNAHEIYDDLWQRREGVEAVISMMQENQEMVEVIKNDGQQFGMHIAKTNEELKAILDTVKLRQSKVDEGGKYAGSAKRLGIIMAKYIQTQLPESEYRSDILAYIMTLGLLSEQVLTGEDGVMDISLDFERACFNSLNKRNHDDEKI